MVGAGKLCRHLEKHTFSSGGDSAFWEHVNVNIRRTQNAFLSRYCFYCIHYLQILSLTFDIIHIIDIFTQTFSFIFSPEQTDLELKSFGGFSINKLVERSPEIWVWGNCQTLVTPCWAGGYIAMLTYIKRRGSAFPRLFCMGPRWLWWSRLVEKTCPNLALRTHHWAFWGESSHFFNSAKCSSWNLQATTTTALTVGAVTLTEPCVNIVVLLAEVKSKGVLVLALGRKNPGCMVAIPTKKEIYSAKESRYGWSTTTSGQLQVCEKLPPGKIGWWVLWPLTFGCRSGAMSNKTLKSFQNSNATANLPTQSPASWIDC